MYEWILGMGYRTLCKNSRLFLMPCELYVGLPLSSLIPNRFQSSTVFIAFSTTTYALYSPPIRLWIKYRLTWAWSQWCEFGLTEIYGWCFEEEEGLVYENILVFHPGAPSNIRASFEHSGTFYTHVSLLHPHRGYKHPPASAHGQQSDRSHLLALALRAIYPSPQAEEAICATVQKVDQLDPLRGSRHDGDDPGPSTQSKTGAASAPLPVFNARLLARLSKELEEGMSIFLHPISVPSIWSADCLATGGELATDPAASSAAQGPTESQQIASQ
ncbi:hypothetical protein DFJ43DRAFT_1159042 [Lentinula guzmanii]|uniref:Uncharacterized protein n=1 Tax=Lentinula guzmanii TaxID=2804957 RepID=A0AA38JBL2_9AGAR|nr:hypothetical protein DFJ43DRAFT_1159042 [Lentinula guzmanii]